MSKLKQNVVYLAAPYSHPHADIRKSRVAEASRVAARLMEHGFVVFSPITHGDRVADFLDEEVRLDHAFWMDQSLGILARCDFICTVPLSGWRNSTGVAAERRLASSLGMPSYIWQEDHPAIEVVEEGELQMAFHGMMVLMDNPFFNPHGKGVKK